MSSTIRRIFSSIASSVLKIKDGIIQLLFKSSEKRRKAFEVAGYILVTYHVYAFLRMYIRNRGISNNYKKDLVRYKNPQSGKNWIIVVVLNKHFSVESKFMQVIGEHELSVFYSKYFKVWGFILGWIGGLR